METVQASEYRYISGENIFIYKTNDREQRTFS